MKKKWRKKLTKGDYLFFAISAFVFAGLMYLVNHQDNQEYGFYESLIAGVLFTILNLVVQTLFGNAFSKPNPK